MAFGDLKGTLIGVATSPGTGISGTGSVVVALGDLVVFGLGSRGAATLNQQITVDNLGNFYSSLPNVTAPGQLDWYSVVTTAGTLTSIAETQVSDTGDLALVAAVYEGPFLHTHDACPGLGPTSNTGGVVTGPGTGLLFQANEKVVGITGGNANSIGVAGIGNQAPWTIDVKAESATGANSVSCFIVGRTVSAVDSVAPQYTLASGTPGMRVYSFRKNENALLQGTHKGGFRVGVAAVTNPTVLRGHANVSNNDLVVVTFSEQTSLTCTAVTDNLGNTYTAVNAGTDAGTTTARMFYSLVDHAGDLTTLNVAATASNDDAVGCAAAYQGPFSASPLDANPANTTDATSPFTTAATGALAQASELIVASNSDTAATVGMAADSPLTRDAAGGATLRCTIASIIVGSTASASYTFSNGSPTDAVQIIASFKLSVTDDGGSGQRIFRVRPQQQIPRYS